MPARTWTDEQLTVAIARASRWRHVCVALGLTAGGRAYTTLRRHADRLGLDTSHLPGLVDERPLQVRRFTDEDLSAALADCSSFAAVLRQLGYVPSST